MKPRKHAIFRMVRYCLFGASLMSPGAWAAENVTAPRMVPIPAGKITSATCPVGVAICPEHEYVERTVDLPAFDIGEREVSFAEWDACVRDGGCIKEESGWAYQNRPVLPPCVDGEVCQYPDDASWGRGSRPVINVSWDDVQMYLAWLNKKTGGNYRLPTAQEWEYAALAGAKTTYPWGAKLGKNHANCADCGSRWDKQRTAPVGSFKPNRFGVYDMVGNVSEWVATCFPTRARGSQQCATYQYRGGAWSHGSASMNPRLYGDANDTLRQNFLGFRLARSR